MLHVPTEFPHPGSRAFVRGSAEPVTILRRNADGSTFVRREPRDCGATLERRNRSARSAASATARPQRSEDIASADAGAEIKGASGNTTLPHTDLFATPEEASLQNTARVSRTLKRRAPASAGLAPRKGSGAQSRLRRGKPAEGGK